MKTKLAVLFLSIAKFVAGQEFTSHDNGLIYSKAAMEKLASIVNVKNGEFRSCDLSKPYAAKEQTLGVFIDVSGFRKSEMKNYLKDNICIEDLLDKLNMELELDYRLVIKNDFENYKGERIVQIRQEPNRRSIRMHEDDYSKADYGSYILDKEEDILIYLKEPFLTKPLPLKYARQMQYADCLIDTTTTVFREGAVRGGVSYSYSEQEKDKQNLLMQYIAENFPVAKPKYPTADGSNSKEIQKVYDSIVKWGISKRKFVRTELVRREKFKELFEEAYQEACKNKNSSDEFEDYVAMVKSYDAALELKRNRIVVGGCSMDQSPRFHAQSIAKLSAEAFRWDIFLRAHLDIMNDNVSRVSDGSWAWADRKTYIKELEELNIDVVDLIMGISFRSSNADEGHYYGSISRLGRAIVESKDQKKFERTILGVITDENLDDYNRLIGYYLYDNMQWHKDTTEAKKGYQKSMDGAIKLLPEYLRPTRS